MRHYRFGPFDVDAQSGELRKHGSRIRIQKQPFQILVTLIERAGEVVNRNDLRESVWGSETFVDFDHGLNAAVNKIRRALGDSSDRAVYIETLPGEGYRFVGALEKPAESEPVGIKPVEAPVHEVPAPAIVPRRWSGLVAAAAVVLAVSVVGYLVVHRPPRLTDKDTVVLADFINSTGDAEFDDMLREALAIQLEESPFLKVLNDDRMIEDLQLMRRPPGTRITNDLAREICQRENDRATIHGAIADLGKAFSITLQATDCQSGSVLARKQIEAPDKERALEAVAAAARGLREKLGESPSSIRPAAPPASAAAAPRSWPMAAGVGPDRVTTTSLEAFRIFALGAAQFRQGKYIASIPIFKRAVEMDPNFQTAWIYLGISWLMSGDLSNASSALQRAFDIRDRVSERESLLVASDYQFYVMRDWEKAREVSDLWIHMYPRDAIPHVGLGNISAETGSLEDSLREYQRADALGTSAVVKSQVATGFVRLNRFHDAMSYIRREFARSPDDMGLHRTALRISLMEDDDVSTRREVQWFSARPEEYMSLETQATNAFVRGQRRREEELLREARQSRTRLSLAPSALSAIEEDALAGSCESTRNAKTAGPVGLALCGNSLQLNAALKKTESGAAARPYDSDLALAEALARAALSLSQDHPDAAVAQLRSMNRVEIRHPEVIYLRGLALFRLHRGADAATEFRKIIDGKGNYWGPYYPVSYAGLARSQTLAGERSKARRTYLDFFALWRYADPEIPLLKQARAEYAALQ